MPYRKKWKPDDGEFKVGEIVWVTIRRLRKRVEGVVVKVHDGSRDVKTANQTSTYSLRNIFHGPSEAKKHLHD